MHNEFTHFSQLLLSPLVFEVVTTTIVGGEDLCRINIRAMLVTLKMTTQELVIGIVK